MDLNNTLEFEKIIDKLLQNTISDGAKKYISLIKPYLNEKECKIQMDETTEGKRMIENFGNPPLSEMNNLNDILDLCEKGSMLTPEQLTAISQFINSCNRMKNYLKKGEINNISVSTYGKSFFQMNDLYENINSSIRNNTVCDSASPRLKDLRRKIGNINDSVKKKLDSILQSKKKFFSDAYVVTRSGRYVLPIKKEYKNQISGTVIDISSTGNTYFIEPTQVRKLIDDLNSLEIEEENEIRIVLYNLTDMVANCIPQLKINIECMETLDFIFAKSKLSIDMKAIPVKINTNRKIIIKQGRHPLLSPETCVPLDFEIGGDTRGIIITGPNTGGKTVALKTVGLLSIMAQSGLHIPVNEGSEFCMNSNILCDIGDGQSISENLSTFSAHITNIIDILSNTSNESLVLLDELGSGTDPTEGMGLAISILEELRNLNCLFIATTHYPEIKDYANKTNHLVNAKMGFNRENLKPLYKLQIGEAGESCALYIAEKLGFPATLLNRATKFAYGDANIHFDNKSHYKKQNVKRIIKDTNLTKNDTAEKFSMGDSVMIYPQKTIGIIYKSYNDKGDFIVQIKDTKQIINHKRIKLLSSASELYPENYDFSIIFDSVENRKIKHDFSRKYSSELEIKYDENYL